MFLLDRKKFEALLTKRGQTLSKLAGDCGISRQSLYAMFNGESIFSTPFQKILRTLGVEFEQLVSSRGTHVLESAPLRIQKAALELETYAHHCSADLFLFGSRARNKLGIRADWDFAFFFPKDQKPSRFAVLKERVQDIAFPYRIDIVHLNDAPAWFLQSVAEDAVRIAGTTRQESIFRRRAA